MCSCIYIYIYIYISSSSSRVGSIESLDAISIRLYHPSFWQLYWTASSVRTVLIHLSIYCSTNTGVSMSKSLLENFLTFSTVPTVSQLSCLTGSLWLYSSLFVGYCFQDVLKIAQRFFTCSYLDFSPSFSLISKWWSHILVLILLQLGRIPLLFWPSQLGL